jgi:hypothetical protein
VLIELDGKRVVVPMRYRCRLPGWTEADEKQKPGLQRAAGQSVDGLAQGLRLHAWPRTRRRLFRKRKRDGQNVVLRFDPTPPQPMQVACLWTRTEIQGGDDLWSFAAITDDPPPEVEAAGHDRCIVPTILER